MSPVALAFILLMIGLFLLTFGFSTSNLLTVFLGILIGAVGFWILLTRFRRWVHG